MPLRCARRKTLYVAAFFMRGGNVRGQAAGAGTVSRGQCAEKKERGALSTRIKSARRKKSGADVGKTECGSGAFQGAGEDRPLLRMRQCGRKEKEKGLKSYGRIAANRAPRKIARRLSRGFCVKRAKFLSSPPFTA